MRFVPNRIKLLTLWGGVSALFFSGAAFADYQENYVGDMETYTAVYEDTLIHLARKHDLGFVEVRAANPMLDPWIPGDGAQVVLPKRHLLPDAPREGLVINLAEMRVFAYLNGDEAPYTYPLGIGREGLDTPMGKTTVTRKKEGPTWRPTERMREEDPELPSVVPPGPDNPLGTHAIYLGWPTYAIHGTNRPYGIGRRVSSGCIRMYPEDVARFFAQVPVGSKVNVIHQPIKVAWIGNELYLEAHPDMEEAIKMEETGLVSNHKLSDDDMSLIIDRAGQYQDLLNWPRIRAAVRERAGYPIRIARYFESDAGTADGQDKEATEQNRSLNEHVEKKTIEVSASVDVKEQGEVSEHDLSVDEDIIVPTHKPALGERADLSNDVQDNEAVVVTVNE
ncbi:MAG: L,D-transpeptidase family protein [Alphaproteobacteria bacterium]